MSRFLGFGTDLRSVPVYIPCMAYLAIEDYGLIGNMHTAALVGRNGSIDWLCMPHFDSPSVFAAILDDAKGGYFKVAPVIEQYTRKQVYWPETNVLITRFLSDEGVIELVDYMPVGLKRGEPGFRQLVRRVEMIRGAGQVKLECIPAFNYARDPHTTELHSTGAIFRSKSLDLELTTSIPLDLKQDRGGVEAIVKLSQGDRATFVLRPLDPESQGGRVIEPDLEQRLLDSTIEYWRKWISRCKYSGRWRETVHRSALMLKLLTFEPTGAIIASPTCSLPEAIPGSRNWDYRYTWIRDASFSLYALLRLGYTEEAAAFMGWLEKRCHERHPDGGLQIMYGLHGEQKLTEETLDHLDGYRGAKPVRIGNGAYGQLQLDIYGELMDSVYLYNKYGSPISYDLWVELSQLVDWVCKNWNRPDEGIWETRGGKQHFVYSKLMCWVAVDRGLRLAEKRSLPADRATWTRVRDEIYLDIMKRGWSNERQAFVQHYGSNQLDASTLIMPLVFFMTPDDPRMLKTLDAICREPQQDGLLSDSLVYRYNVGQFDDGLPGEEGTFNMCTFWLVEALTRAGRTDKARLAQARLIFEKMLGYANHLGLYAEETGLHGEALGNYPQAFTHLALISAAYNLDRTLENGRCGPA
ncbi:MAG TPA: glycoside hydrolase family 15 protein [Tepidisphaeraceae bacterium]|jgi:GH15 family glucan-1,4-alpha-glucosidase|nr:glycoside hydrolase family 15 protein [Tepidisphaeraceae bacterium]